MESLDFRVWMFLLCTEFVTFICRVGCSSWLFTLMLCSIRLCECSPVLFIHVHGLVGSSQFRAILNNAVMMFRGIQVQAFLLGNTQGLLCQRMYVCLPLVLTAR